MNIIKIILGTMAFFFSSFVIQGMLAFMMAGNYFESILIFRPEPILPLAMGQTILSGIAFSILFPMTNFKGSAIVKGLKFGLLVGLIMIPFIAMDIPARFVIPVIGTWIGVQGLLGLIHYMLAGLLVGLIYKQQVKK